MNRSILLSIKPKWVAKILNGEKTIEIRKTMPKCDLPITVYIYCSKEKWRTKPLLLGNIVPNPKADPLNKHNIRLLNGKVVAKFTLRKVEEIYDGSVGLFCIQFYNNIDETSLSYEEIEEYCGSKIGYAYHIEDLVIFDKPKELSDFMPIKWNKCGVKDKNGLYQCHKCPYGEVLSYGGECHYKPLKRPPQSYMFVESEE